jgi:AraC-like DNA-binding protein
MRRHDAVSAGAVEHRATELIEHWHSHEMHEIEYAVAGLAELRTRTTHYVLPAAYAAWIPAGVAHAPRLQNVTTIAVFFDPTIYSFDRDQPAIIPVSPLLREMLRYATRWRIDRRAEDAEARTFFCAIADVVRRELEFEAPFASPLCDDPVIAEVLAYTTAHLCDVTAADVCRAVGLSERAMRRRFATELGVPWREHLQRARLLRAMALLSEPTRSVSEIAASVGFGSASALARAFRAWTGESPLSYRGRWLDESTTPNLHGTE